MCAGALVHARIRTLVFGAREPRAGAVVSTASAIENAALNHRVEVVEGVLADDCGALLKAFFRAAPRCGRRRLTYNRASSITGLPMTDTLLVLPGPPAFSRFVSTSSWPRRAPQHPAVAGLYAEYVHLSSRSTAS